MNGTQEEKLEWTFHLYDLDGDGVITREEMEDVAMSVSSCKVFMMPALCLNGISFLISRL